MNSNQNTIIEQRKRPFEQTSNEFYEPKRSIFTTIKDFILHPIDSLTPKQKKVTTISLQLYQRNDGDVEIKLKEKNKEKDTVRFTEHCDYNKEIESIKQNVETLIKQALTGTSVASVLIKKGVSVVQENDYVKPNEAEDEKSFLVMEDKKTSSILNTPLKTNEIISVEKQNESN